MNQFDWKGILTGIVVGSVLSIGGTLFYMSNTVAVLEEKIQTLEEQGQTSTEAPNNHQSSIQKVQPEKIIRIIEERQRKHVRKSTGELAHESFTEDDLTQFIENKTPERITATLKTDKSFIEVAIAIKQLPASERETLLETGRNTFRPTWAELGRIDPEGQTDAGQEADKLIAEAIVQLTQELINKSDSDLEKLYES